MIEIGESERLACGSKCTRAASTMEFDPPARAFRVKKMYRIEVHSSRLMQNIARRVIKLVSLSHNLPWQYSIHPVQPPHDLDL